MLFVDPIRRRSAFALAGLIATLLPGCAWADGLTYLAHPPARAQGHPPLIVLLHGAGADERDMITMARDLPPDFVVVSPRAPFCEGGGCRWYRKAGATPRPDDLAASRKVIDLIVAEAAKRFDVDPERVFLGGFSQGGVMTYDVVLREPGRFRGAVVLSGSLAASSTAAAAAADRRTPFFIAHGTADPRILFSAAHAADVALERRSVPVAFHGYAGMRHETTVAELEDLRAWLADQANAASHPH